MNETNITPEIAAELIDAISWETKKLSAVCTAVANAIVGNLNGCIKCKVKSHQHEKPWYSLSIVFSCGDDLELSDCLLEFFQTTNRLTNHPSTLPSASLPIGGTLLNSSQIRTIKP